MSLLASIPGFGWIAARRRRAMLERADSPPPYFSGENRYGIGDAGGTNQITLARNLLGPQATSVKAVAERVQSIRWVAEEKTTDMEGTVVWETLSEHPLADLLLKPNPYFTAMQIRYMLAQWFLQLGEAYLVKVTDGSGITRELWPIEPHLTSIEQTTAGLQYRYRSGGGEAVYQQDEIVRIFRPDIENPFRALGNLAPQGLVYDAEKYQTETMRKHFKDDATPPVMMKHTGDAEPPTGDMRNAVDREWSQRHNQRTGTKSGLPYWLPNGVDPMTLDRQMSTTPEMQKYFEDRVYRANGVPRAVLGDVQDANRANMDSAQYGFDLFTVKPVTDLIGDCMTAWVAADYDGELRVGWEQFILEDADLRLRTEDQDLRNKVRVINEIRAQRGLDEVDYGEEPVGTFGDTPYRPDEEQSDPFAPASEPPQEDEPEEDEERRLRPGTMRGHLRSDYFSREANHARIISLEANYVPPMARAYRYVLSLQASETAKRIMGGRMREDGIADAIDLDGLFDEERWRDVYRAQTEPIRRDAFRQQILSTFVGFNLAADAFVWTDEVTRSLAKAARDMQIQVDGTTKRLIAEQLQIGFDEGDGIEAIARRIQSVYSRRRKDARTIARTEVGRASTEATLASHNQLDVPRHEWLTSLDEAVRESHQRLHGTVVDVGSPFKLHGKRGVELALGPRVGQGAPLSAGEAINCRCTLAPVLD